MIAVVGSAPCYMQDLGELLWQRPDCEIAVINRMISVPFKYNYHISMHGDMFRDAITEEKKKRDFVTISNTNYGWIDECCGAQKEASYGGSVAYAISIFGNRNYRVVLCGCPFDATGHHDDANGNYHDKELWDWFMRGHPYRAAVNDNVRSMSGKTRELFGYPTKEWLNEPCI